MFCIRRLSNNQNWNIGFTDDTPKSVLENKSVGKIEWMKHPYRDRFFADPFIYSVTDDDIMVIAEECEFENPKGRIVELVVDRKTKKLKNRYVLLENEFHLSYPAIVRVDEEVYVYPENSASGKLNIYRYNKDSHSLAFLHEISNFPLVDATMRKVADGYLLMATKADNSQEDVYLYRSNEVVGPFEAVASNPIIMGRKVRPAGDFFNMGNIAHRPSQNCEKRYGAAIVISKVLQIESKYEEQELFEIKPNGYRYNLGMHTINFFNGVCVVDGYGYLYPVIGRLYHRLSVVKNRLIK